jgi:hypothetical protein
MALDERDRQRPVVVADTHLRSPGAFLVDYVLLIVKSDEVLMTFLISISVT